METELRRLLRQIEEEYNAAYSHDPYSLFSASYSHEVLATEGSIFLVTAVWTGGALCTLASLLHRTQQFPKKYVAK